MNTIYIYLNAAMGDTLFLLSACKAIKKTTGENIIFVIPPHFVSLAKACPHISEAWRIDTLSHKQKKRLQEAHASRKFFDFTNWHHALRPMHMIDSFLSQMGIESTAADKQLDIIIPDSAIATVNTFYELHNLASKPVLLLHPNIGHANRTWPLQNWHELAKMWIQTGWHVIFIGSNNNSEAGKMMPKECPEGVINAIEKFSPLETIALMKRANLLVSCDSGPVMLAAATSIPIIALYSTIAGKHRLPFRNKESGWNCLGIDLACANGPCSRLMLNETIFTKLLQRPFGLPTTLEFSNWCVNTPPFQCLSKFQPEKLYILMANFILDQ